MDGQQLLNRGPGAVKLGVLWGAIGLAAIGVPALAAAPGVVPPFAAIGFLVLGFAVWHCRNASLLAITAGVGYLGEWLTGWHLAPLLVVMLCVAHRAMRHEVFQRPRRGGWPIWGSAVGFGAISGFVVWWLWVEPLLSNSDLRWPLLPPELIAPVVAAVAVLSLSATNAIFEESVWRGSVLNGLISVGVPRIVAVPIASFAFGVAHFNGMPAGLLGVVLTTIFAVAACSLAIWTRSLVPGMLAHAIADVAILWPLST